MNSFGAHKGDALLLQFARGSSPLTKAECLVHPLCVTAWQRGSANCLPSRLLCMLSNSEGATKPSRLGQERTHSCGAPHKTGTLISGQVRREGARCGGGWSVREGGVEAGRCAGNEPGVVVDGVQEREV